MSDPSAKSKFADDLQKLALVPAQPLTPRQTAQMEAEFGVALEAKAAKLHAEADAVAFRRWWASRAVTEGAIPALEARNADAQREMAVVDTCGPECDVCNLGLPSMFVTLENGVTLEICDERDDEAGTLVIEQSLDGGASWHVFETVGAEFVTPKRGFSISAFAIIALTLFAVVGFWLGSVARYVR